MPVIIILFVALVVVLIFHGMQAAEKRRKALAAWARSRGLSYSADHDDSMEERFCAFDCLEEGSDRYAYNVMGGDWGGRELLGFDYHYETSSTDSKGNRTTSDWHFSAVILTSEVPLRPLFIRPEGFLDRVSQFLGFDDIDFESAEFSRKFYVKSPDKRWAYDVIHQRTMEFLLSMPTFTLRFDRHHVMAWRSSTFEPGEFSAAAELVAGILDRLPEYVVRQQRDSV